jgi:hypothetical protein
MSDKVGKLTYRAEQFLGKQEQEKLQELMINRTLSVLQKFGTSGLFDLSKESCSLIRGGSVVTLNVDKPFLAGFDTGFNLIFLDQTKTSTSTIVPPIGTRLYVSLRAQENTFEAGIVSVSITGEVTGEGTEFFKIFRNSIEGRVSKLKVGENIYSIQTVFSDTQLQLVGTTFIPIDRQNFSIVGTFSPYVGNSQANETIYSYASAELVVSPDVPNETTHFKIGEFTYNGAGVSTIMNFSQSTILKTFGSNSVGTTELEDRSVTTPKYALKSVTSDILSDGSVTPPKLPPGSIDGTKLSMFSIRSTHILPDAIQSAHLEKGCVTLEKQTVQPFVFEVMIGPDWLVNPVVTFRSILSPTHRMNGSLQMDAANKYLVTGLSLSTSEGTVPRFTISSVTVLGSYTVANNMKASYANVGTSNQTLIFESDPGLPIANHAGALVSGYIVGE